MSVLGPPKPYPPFAPPRYDGPTGPQLAPVQEGALSTFSNRVGFELSTFGEIGRGKGNREQQVPAPPHGWLAAPYVRRGGQ